MNEGGYLDIRNYILYLWKKNPRQYLSFELCMEKILDKFVEDAARIFEYLERHGDINVGRFKDDIKKRSRSSYSFQHIQVESHFLIHQRSFLS